MNVTWWQSNIFNCVSVFFHFENVCLKLKLTVWQLCVLGVLYVNSFEKQVIAIVNNCKTSTSALMLEMMPSSEQK